MGTIPIRAEGRDSRAIKRALRVLSEGRILGIFPEGTRSPDGQIRETRRGAALLAALSGAPVVPTYIDGARTSLPVGGRFPAPARVHVRFGPPLRFERGAGGHDREALLAFSPAMGGPIRRLESVA